jgi:hypothetical protein
MFLLDLSEKQIISVLVGSLIFHGFLYGVYYLVRLRKKRLKERELNQKDR